MMRCFTSLKLRHVLAMLVYSSFPLVGGLRPDCSHGISSTLYVTAVLSLASINLLLKHLIKAARKRTL